MRSTLARQLNTLHRYARRTLLVGALSIGTSVLLQGGGAAFVPAVSWARGETSQLLRQLETSKDFRLRMQAALELGKQKTLSARAALEAALSDESAAVRAAAAAALKSLGDKRALPALRRASSDQSEAVRNQIASAIEALDAIGEAAYLVGVGDIENDSSVEEKSVERYLLKVTHRKLSRMPDVLLKHGQRAPGGLPELVLDARLSRLRVQQSSSTLAVSAKVDFVLSRMPGREIKGRLSGSATVHGDPRSDKSPSDLERLRMEAVEAATDSALQNVSRALRAAVE